MPSSLLALAPAVLAMAYEALDGDAGPTGNVLDVGPGNGKYGLLLREYVSPTLNITASEAERRYTEKFPWLYCVYDDVWIGDVARIPQADFDKFHLVLMIDVLEHLPHDVGARLLQRIPCRVIVLTPRDFFQNPEAANGWPTEEHRSVWTVEEIAAIRELEVVDQDALDRLGGVLVRTAPLK